MTRSKTRRVVAIALAVCALGVGAVVTPTAQAGPPAEYTSEPSLRWLRDDDPSSPGHQIAMIIKVGNEYPGLAGTFELFEGATVPVSGVPIATLNVSGSGENKLTDTTVDVTSSSRFSVRFTTSNALFASRTFENLRIICNPGRYSVDGFGPCTLAPAGGFVEFDGQTFWSACPPGKFQPEAGQMYCFDAPPGSYADSMQSSQATLCNMGYFQPDAGAISCRPADVGWFVPAMGAIEQIRCPAGLTNATPGSTTCDVAVPVTTTTLPPLCCAQQTTTTVASQVLRKPAVPGVPRTLKVRRTATIALKKGRNSNGLVTTVSTGSRTCTVRKSAKGYTVAGVSRGVCSITIRIKGNAKYSSTTVRRSITVTR